MWKVCLCGTCIIRFQKKWPLIFDQTHRKLKNIGACVIVGTYYLNTRWIQTLLYHYLLSRSMVAVISDLSFWHSHVQVCYYVCRSHWMLWRKAYAISINLSCCRSLRIGYNLLIVESAWITLVKPQVYPWSKAAPHL